MMISVIPAKTGTHLPAIIGAGHGKSGVPAFAGMTEMEGAQH